MWRSYLEDEAAQIISIPRLVEGNASQLRDQYLSWIFELGETIVDGERVVDQLELDSGFSFWWMSLISQKLNYSTSPHITTAIRLLAFDSWASDKDIESVLVCSSDPDLVECLNRWCSERGLRFAWQRSYTKFDPRNAWRRFLSYFPDGFRALIYLCRRLWISWPLKGIGLNCWSRADGDVCLFSYLLPADVTNEQQVNFESRYWTALPHELRGLGYKVTWLHLFIADQSQSSTKQARKKLEQLNTSGDEVHTSLDSFLDFPVVLRALKDWCRISRLGAVLAPAAAEVAAGGVWLWPLFRKEWHTSMAGIPSLNSILDLHLFKRAIGLLPKQSAGVYLYEQQAWEFALIDCWRQAGHGLLVGAQHTTILDWNLRKFHDPRSYERLNHNDLPMPDLVAVNGPVARHKVLESGYPEERLFDVEALRFLYLENVPKEREVIQTQKNDTLRILVLGDFLESNTRNQIRLLAEVIASFSKNVEVIVKPHPASIVSRKDFPGIDMEVVCTPISELLVNCDLVYCSPVTSAAVDAYCFRVPVVTLLDYDALNLSPLRNYDDVIFVSSSEELLAALDCVAFGDFERNASGDFFYLNSKLPRWKSLISRKNDDV